MRLLLATLVAALVAATVVAVPARSAGGVRLVTVGSFSSPVHVTAPPGDERRLFVVEQGGLVRVVRDGRTLPAPFLDVRGLTEGGGEQGLLSMAFAPDYARSGRFYVFYTDTEGAERVVEYRRSAASPDRADAGSARLVLRQPDAEPNHNGGLVAFGPDGLLYVGVGDGGGAGDRPGRLGNGQSLATWEGKLLRIDPRESDSRPPRPPRPYSVPASNPFTGRSGARPEIYAYGLRNPWRFSFDRATGDLAIGDVGQSEVEEISFRRRGRTRGANFGWRVWEGRRRFAPGESAPGHVRPVIERRHAAGACSITGGVVVRDPALPRSLRGRYLFGDVCDARVLSSRLSGSGATPVRSVGVRVPSLVSFGEDARGRVHLVSLDGRVSRLAAR